MLVAVVGSAEVSRVATPKRDQRERSAAATRGNAMNHKDTEATAGTAPLTWKVEGQTQGRGLGHNGSAHGASLAGHKNTLERDGGGGHTALSIHQMPLNCSL